MNALRLLKVLPLLLVSLVAVDHSPSLAHREIECESWDGTEDFQDALVESSCVSVVPGSYTVDSPTDIFNAKTIYGNGATITFAPPVGFPMNVTTADYAIFYIQPGGDLTISNLTLDGANTISYLITPNHYNADHMTLRNAACSAFGIGGPGVSITNNTLTHNGWACLPYSGVPEGAGIYAAGAGSMFSPWIAGNTITGSNGPAIDINGVWGGTFAYNTVTGNAKWAGVSLYGASYWNVTHNLVSHPATTDTLVYHPYCQPSMAPIGNRSAAIFLCQDMGSGGLYTNYNTISTNTVSSGYGILLVGADEVQPWMTPRLNNIVGNSVIGSLYGCADDLKLNQWFDANTWSNNNCAGTPNTPPSTF